MLYYWIGGTIIFLLAFAAMSPMLLAWQRRREVARAIADFQSRREQLEAKFFDIARSLGKPRGLRWTECDWKETVHFVRDKESGLLTAFAAVEIHFEAIEGGGMEDVAAVTDVRDASAVFHYDGGTWGTGGRALFNMNPDIAIQKLQHQYTPLTL